MCVFCSTFDIIGEHVENWSMGRKIKGKTVIAALRRWGLRSNCGVLHVLPTAALMRYHLHHRYIQQLSVETYIKQYKYNNRTSCTKHNQTQSVSCSLNLNIQTYGGRRIILSARAHKTTTNTAVETIQYTYTDHI